MKYRKVTDSIWTHNKTYKPFTYGNHLFSVVIYNHSINCTHFQRAKGMINYSMEETKILYTFSWNVKSSKVVSILTDQIFSLLSVSSMSRLTFNLIYQIQTPKLAVGLDFYKIHGKWSRESMVYCKPCENPIL